MSEKKNNGATVGAIVGLLALIAGVYAMVQPMHQRIDHANTRLLEFKTELRRIFDREREDSQGIATMNERFKEVETQFRLFQEVNATKFQELERRVFQTEIDGNPRHDERIKNLERLNGIGEVRERK